MLIPIQPFDSDSHTDTTGPPDGKVSGQYLLVCGARSQSLQRGTWHFSLETINGDLVLEASDDDFGDLNRLTLLAALRGLESIDGPSAVALLSNNRYLIRSLSDSLPRWRRNHFVWDHFGRRVDVQHADLWRRVDRTLGIHRVEACLVSSRVVSEGSAETPALRFDVGGGHPGGVPTRSRRPGHRPHAPSATHRSEADPSTGATGDAAPAATHDRLRHWLFSPPSTRGPLPRQERAPRKPFFEPELTATGT